MAKPARDVFFVPPTVRVSGAGQRGEENVDARLDARPDRRVASAGTVNEIFTDLHVDGSPSRECAVASRRIATRGAASDAAAELEPRGVQPAASWSEFVSR